MEERRNIEEIILNGTEDELNELRLWLFKESVRLENHESALEERYARLEADQIAFKDRMDAAERKLENATKKLNNDKALFDQRLSILNNGFDQLNSDKKKLEAEYIRLEREKAYQRENEYDALDLLFRGVNSPLTLKKRYKDLMKMFHPDNVSGDQDMVQLINEEYSMLCRQYNISMIN
ncbi:J domain-containing protein [Butyrivibrio proteoclasticus]|uniref:J domain-containing protein n=1 Tax=Butyrivibrio proteoclasticus TaxID=43305 RepID=UPI00047CD017|nr:J domain-containing protein [Butyrivibrio proteoclasticus]